MKDSKRFLVGLLLIAAVLSLVNVIVEWRAQSQIVLAEPVPGSYLPYVQKQEDTDATPTPLATPTNEALQTPDAPTATATAVPAGAYLETFDGDPPHPENYRPNPRLDVVIHTRGDNDKYQLEPLEGHHGPNCEPPLAMHPIMEYEEAVYNCKNHVMSAFLDEGGGYIYFTPNHQVDFSEGPAIVRFDASTLRAGGRDWISLWLTPFEENLEAPVGEAGGIQGPPKNAIRLEMNTENAFKLSIFRDYEETDYTWSDATNSYTGYHTFLEPSAKRRDTFELIVSQDHIKFGMPDYGFSWVDMDIDVPFDWNQAIVQFGHASYNPEKDCDSGAQCGPNTWHWDNFYIEPAIPFTIIPANRRFVDPTAPAALLFDEPSPENARLRFAGFGSRFEVSFDGGESWQEAQPQKAPQFGKFATYWTPMPSGVTSVLIRGDEWESYGWHARDISIWSLETQ